MRVSLDGDAAAYGALLARLAAYLRGYFGRRLGADAADVEDLVQDTLLAIHLKRESYDRAQLFTPWVYAMARYKLLDHFRRAGVRRTVPIEDAGALFAVETADEGLAKRDVAVLLERLLPAQRDLVRDVKLAGLSLAETSEKTGLSTTAIKVKIHRSLRALARMVADDNR